MRYATQLKYSDSFEYALKCAKNAGFKYISVGFGGTKMTSLSDVMAEVHLSVNPDYPHTTPKGGTGYGAIIKESCSIK